MNTSIRNRTMILIAAMVIITAASTYMRADTGTCGGTSITLPFTDVPSGSVFFCSIAEAYIQALTNGTTPTTYNPSDPVPREQMAAFITRTLDRSLTRGSRRAAHTQFWTTTPQYTITAGTTTLGTTVVGTLPRQVQSDSADLWVANATSGTVSRVRASDAKLLETWTGATNAYGVLIAMNRVFVTGDSVPGTLYMIEPSQVMGAVTTVASTLGNHPEGIAFDGSRIWTANSGSSGTDSISIITPGSPFTVTNVSGINGPLGVLYDGANIWVTAYGTGIGNGHLYKLNSSGGILLTITVGNFPYHPVFDGTNIWVPNQGSSSITVVRPSDGMVLATLTGNGLRSPITAAFDGQRILVTNLAAASVSLWNASDLTPLGSFVVGGVSQPFGACSDGLNFWLTLEGSFNKLARF